MAAIDALRKRWREEARFQPFRPYLYIDNEGLSLGAGTLLAPMVVDRTGLSALALDGKEARILATLSLGFCQPVSIGALKFIRRASMQWGRDEKALAHFELAYARLPRFETRDDAESLFLADGFVRLGLSPCALMLAHGLDTSQLDLLKFIPHFNPNEPRVPGGHHRQSGRWTQGDSAATADDQSATDAGTYIQPVVEDEGPEEREKEKELPQAERRALRAPSTKEDVEEGHGIRIQTPLVENEGTAGQTPESAANGSGGVAKTIEISPDRFGEAAVHARDAIQAGRPDVLTIDRAGRNANRTAATGGLEKVPGMHLDEYPPAMFKEGGAGASVRAISPHDNMSMGAYIGFCCRRLPNGARIKI